MEKFTAPPPPPTPKYVSFIIFVIFLIFTMCSVDKIYADCGGECTGDWITSWDSYPYVTVSGTCYIVIKYKYRQCGTKPNQTNELQIISLSYSGDGCSNLNTGNIMDYAIKYLLWDNITIFGISSYPAKMIIRMPECWKTTTDNTIIECSNNTACCSTTYTINRGDLSVVVTDTTNNLPYIQPSCSGVTYTNCSYGCNSENIPLNEPFSLYLPYACKNDLCINSSWGPAPDYKFRSIRFSVPYTVYYAKKECNGMSQIFIYKIKFDGEYDYSRDNYGALFQDVIRRLCQELIKQASVVPFTFQLVLNQCFDRYFINPTILMPCNLYEDCCYQTYTIDFIDRDQYNEDPWNWRCTDAEFEAGYNNYDDCDYYSVSYTTNEIHNFCSSGVTCNAVCNYMGLDRNCIGIGLYDHPNHIHPKIITNENNQKIINESEAEFNLYPNPTNDIINIESNYYLNDCQINIFNLYGSKIYSNIYNHKDNNIRIDISNYLNGIYFIEISKNNITLIKKSFMVLHD